MERITRRTGTVTSPSPLRGAHGDQRTRRLAGIPKSELGPLEEIAHGDHAIVYRASVALEGPEPVDLAVKLLRRPKKAGIAEYRWRIRAIHESVRFRRRLGREERAQLDAIALWPLDVVHEGGRILGYVMRLIPAEFTLDSQSGRVLAGLGWFQARDSTLRGSGIAAAPFREYPVRLSLMTQFAYCIAWLHAHGRVFGDLNMTRGVFQVSPIRFLLTGCDATAMAHAPQRPQRHDPTLEPPEGIDAPQTFETDVYKLALCVTRVLSDNARPISSTPDPAALSRPLPVSLRLMLTRALSGNPDERPRAKDIWQALDDYLDFTYPQPVIETVTTSPPGDLLRGQDLIVRWRCRLADAVLVTGPGGMEVVSDAPEGMAVLRIAQAGEIRIRAVNAHGHTDSTVREVRVYELNAPRIDPIPGPRVPLPDGWRPRMELPRARIPILPGGVGSLLVRPSEGGASLQREVVDLSGAVQGLQSVLAGEMAMANALLRTAIQDGARSNREMTGRAMRAAADGLRREFLVSGNSRPSPRDGEESNAQ